MAFFVFHLVLAPSTPASAAGGLSPPACWYRALTSAPVALLGQRGATGDHAVLAATRQLKAAPRGLLGAVRKARPDVTLRPRSEVGPAHGGSDTRHLAVSTYPIFDNQIGNDVGVLQTPCSIAQRELVGFSAELRRAQDPPHHGGVFPAAVRGVRAWHDAGRFWFDSRAQDENGPRAARRVRSAASSPRLACTAARRLAGPAMSGVLDRYGGGAVCRTAVLTDPPGSIPGHPTLWGRACTARPRSLTRVDRWPWIRLVTFSHCL